MLTFYLNTALILMIISGFACLTAGLIFIIRGYINKNKKDKVGTGWGLSILGAFTIIFFIIATIRILQEGSNGSSFIFTSWLMLFLFFPIAMLFVIVIAVFFLVIGIGSLREGFKKNNENKRDVVSIVLGFVMLVLLVLVMTSLVMFAGILFGAFGDSLRKAHSSSSNINSTSASIAAVKYYLFSIIYK